MIKALLKNVHFLFLFLLLVGVAATFLVVPTLKNLKTNIPDPTKQLLAQNAQDDSILTSTIPLIKNVFVIVMENHDWKEIKDSSSASYINSLLPQASYATQYYNPTNNHPSEANYLWMEAGTNFGIQTNADPRFNHQSTTNHLTFLLSSKGITWKSYQEDISGGNCPLETNGLYAPKHNPMIFFDDVTDQNNPVSVNCSLHIRPFTELSQDIKNNVVPQYSFITPNLCHDMHNTSDCSGPDAIKNGDDWLQQNLPQILQSGAYKNNGAVFITWDEGSEKSDGSNTDGPVGTIVLSPYAKGNGYNNTIHYTHSSLLRSLEEIFQVTPYLGDAANATDLSDLFVSLSASPKKTIAKAVTPIPRTIALAATVTPTFTPTPIPTSTPTPTLHPTATPQPKADTPRIAKAIVAQANVSATYKSGNNIDNTNVSFTYPKDWEVSYKKDNITLYQPFEFAFISKATKEKATLSIDIYPKAATVKEFVTKNFAEYKDKLVVTVYGTIGNKTLYKISPKADVKISDPVHLDFGTHGVVLGSQHIYDIGFIDGTENVTNQIVKDIWPRFHFE